MNFSGKGKSPENRNIPVGKKTFSERFMASRSLSAASVQINTDAILVFPDLEQEYRIIKELSSGGNAVISLAEDRFLKRNVAVKSLHKNMIADPAKKRAFLREAQLMAQLEHPSIVPVHGIAGDSSGGLHIIMKHVRGISLREYLKDLREMYAARKLSRAGERKSLHDRIELFIRICDAVAFAHSKRVLHGDLKPGNIMIEQSHNVYLMDWGNAEIVRDNNSDFLLNDTISGTPGYLSPEIVRGEKRDFRSEIFTLGLILFEIVTLSKAVTGKSSREILLKLRDGKRNPIRHRFGLIISPVLRGILKKSLQTDPEKRYQSVLEFAESLRSYLTLFSCKEPAQSPKKKIPGKAPFSVIESD
jgi:serine/threonine-protein kinase